ncbi:MULTISPECIES: TrmB family transcriptional regulator [Bacillus]|uniref:TrmB family transcriptional regulator n=1 Tax=Bacillus TaxID=1386 RepID=UPI000D0464D7|nr:MULTISPECIES: helix-turn-helix domain-containing protein [Bacillus]MCI3196956.1 TrmB family transcriptional regulator [Bacillus sp. HU-1818]MCY8515871.1 TrmB family transcriptional regulator [Bacillus atrophaeus]MCY8991358.1 TrmB family transcriptional regulator [Bacillus atrophaeus]MCY9112717.1 TrmB family transcriptional regulator [Bacillus atrophaeus]PRR96130.1 TrmB family transcriptional regulator [Bacillus atrophaeus]
MDDVYKELQKLGFSQYECKAYIGLLKTSPITGYEISKRSGVPRSMIYEVVGKLVDKGAVHTVPSDPVTYAPLPAKELIDRLRHNFENSFDYLEKKLVALESEQDVDVIRRINSNEHVIAEMIDMIDKAEDELWLSLWEPQVAAVKKDIDRRLNENLPVFSILFGSHEIEIGSTTHHNYMSPEVAEERIGGRLTIVARDNQEVLIANFSPNTNAWAIKTQDPALVIVAMEYMRHDLMFSELVKEVGSERAAALWQHNSNLFHVVTGKRFN